MTFSVSPDCLQLGLRAGAILFRDVTVGEASSELQALIVQEVERIRTAYADPQALRSLPEVASFQEILRKIGVNPRKEQPRSSACWPSHSGGRACRPSTAWSMPITWFPSAGSARWGRTILIRSLFPYLWSC